MPSKLAAHGVGAEGAGRPAESSSAEDHSRYRRIAMQWLASDPCGILYVMRQVLGPLDEVMQRYLKVGGIKWKEQQDIIHAISEKHGIGGRGKFIVCMAESGELVGDALDKFVTLMSSEEHWSQLPLRFWQAALRTRACLMLSRAACGIFDLARQHQRYPLKLFGILRDPEVAKVVLEDSKKQCVLDDFSIKFIKKHAASNLVGPSCICELAAIAALMELDTASVEASHASVRRLATVLSVQTHTENILDASAEWVLRRLRAIARSRPVAGAPASEQHAGKVKAGPSSRAAPRKGRGGAWRAYIRQESLGAVGKPCLAELSRRYKELGPRQMRELKEEGKRARNTARAGGVQHASWSSFGLGTRQQVSVARKRAREIAAENAVDSGALWGITADGAGVKIPRLHDSDRALAIVNQLAEPSASSATDSLCGLREASIEDKRHSRLALKIGRERLAAYHQEQAVRIVSELGSASAAIARRASQLSAVPNAGMPTLEWSPVGLTQRVEDVLSVHPKSVKGQSIFPQVVEHWKQAHLPVQGHVGLRAKLDSLPKERRKCNEAGFCICGGEGAGAIQLAFCRTVISEFCPPHSTGRSKLVGGELVMMFVGQTKKDVEECELADMFGEDVLGVVAHASAWQFGHIPDFVLSPMGGWLQVAVPKSGFNAATLECEPPLQVVVGGQPVTSLAWFGQLDKQLRWSAVIFEVDWATQMLGSFTPNQLQLQPFGRGAAITSRIFWDPFKERPMRVRKKVAAWASLDDDLGDIDGDDEKGSDIDEIGEVSSESGVASDGKSEVGEADDPGDIALVDDEHIAVDSDGSSGASVKALEELMVVAEGGGAAAGAGEAMGGSPRGTSSGATTSSSETGSSDTPPGSRSRSSSDSGETDGGSLAGGDMEEAVNRKVQINEHCELQYFGLGARRDFIVHCKAPGHKNCVLTRSANPSAKKARAGQGRCLGKLVAWAEAAGSGEYLNKSQHFKYVPDKAARQAARRAFYALPDSDWFCMQERPQRAGEDSEPDVMR